MVNMKKNDPIWQNMIKYDIIDQLWPNMLNIIKYD